MKRTVAAVEFGTSKVVAVIGETAPGSQGDMTGYGVVPYDGFCNEGWNATDSEIDRAVLSALKAAEQMAGVKPESLYVGVPSKFLTVLEGKAEAQIASIGKKVTMDDVDKIMDAAAQSISHEGVLLHINPAWFMVDDQITMEPADIKGEKLSCLAYAIIADKPFIDEMTARFEGLGRPVAGFVSPSLGEALMVIPPQERDKVAVLIDCGYLSTQLMVVWGDAICHIDTIWDGAGYMTAQLAESLEITMALADQVKRQVILSPDTASAIEIISTDGERMLFTNELAFKAIEPGLNELSGRIKECLAAIKLEIPPKAPFYLTGGGLALMRGAREYLGARIGRQLKPCAAHPSMLTGAGFTSATGLLELVFEQTSSQDSQPAGIMKKIRLLFKK